MKNCIRFLRKKRQMTLEELGEKTGLSLAYISMIEREKRTPSMHTLEKIAEALEVDKEVLWWNSVIREPKAEAHYRLLKKSERPIYQGSYNKDLVYEDITSNVPSYNEETVEMFAMIGKLAPGCNSNPIAQTQHPGNEFVYLIKGNMICEIESETIYMEEEDSLVIEAEMGHRFINQSNEPVEVLMVRVGR